MTPERPPARLGVLGGTFDPPHHGHLWLAASAADALGLDRVVFMPAAAPPHKSDRAVTAVVHRLAMTRAAVADDRAFAVSTLELERTGPSYTVDSMQRVLADRAGAGPTFLIMAADSLEQIETWRNPHRLLELVEWIVGPRPGHATANREGLRARFGQAAERIHLLDGPALDVSGSEIRDRVASGRTIRYLVPRAVEAYIGAQGLYRGIARTE
jgi:nicotinate-nucleotide adenylyltransferase